ncbi:MAG: DUF4388 domain-containing protein [Candidatus Sericytochromatia bacterium]|nr:DUF4388 domain-containing protein [Candidatus Sericytochromatia bacterium]
MKFSGRLADFSLPDVLRIILHGQKTGYLSVSFKGVESKIFINQGQLHHAESNGLQGEKAVFDLMTYDPLAEFEFVEESQMPVQTISSDLDTLIQNGIAYLESWRKLGRLYPRFSVNTEVQSVTSAPATDLSQAEQSLLSLVAVHPHLKLHQLADHSAIELAELLELLVSLEKKGQIQLIGEERVELQQFFLETANTLFSEFESISGIKLKEEITTRLQKIVEENNWNIELQNGRIVGDKIRTITLDEQKTVFSGYLQQLIGLIAPIYGVTFVQQVMEKVEKRFSAPIQHWVDELKLEV